MLNPQEEMCCSFLIVFTCNEMVPSLSIHVGCSCSTFTNGPTTVRATFYPLGFFPKLPVLGKRKQTLLSLQSACPSSRVTCTSAQMTNCLHLFPITLHVLKVSVSFLSCQCVLVHWSGHLVHSHSVCSSSPLHRVTVKHVFFIFKSDLMNMVFLGSFSI